jgi:hypothetical protein
MTSDPNASSGSGKTIAYVIIGIVASGLALLMCCGLVAGLGMVWVQNQRDKYNRLICSSDLGQLGIAYHTYHDVMNAFPTEKGAETETLYSAIIDFVEQANAKNQPKMPIKLFICPSRRDFRAAGGKRDYGYAATSGTGSAGASVFDTPSGATLTAIKNANGTANTLLLSHVWMDPANYIAGDPTDLGWATRNNSRSINDTAKLDSDPSGSVKHIGGPHPSALPSLFADGSVRPVPYDFANWNLLWAWDNAKPFVAPATQYTPPLQK